MSVPVIAAFTLASIFAVAGVVNLIGPRWARRAYDRWDIPSGIYRALGLIELAAAAFFLSPDLRLWGILVAAPIIFGSVVILLEHRQYLYAMPVAAMMALLLATTLAVPHSRPSVRYATQSPAIAAVHQTRTV
jgi:hypothetical protein